MSLFLRSFISHIISMSYLAPCFSFLHIFHILVINLGIFDHVVYFIRLPMILGYHSPFKVYFDYVYVHPRSAFDFVDYRLQSLLSRLYKFFKVCLLCLQHCKNCTFVP